MAKVREKNLYIFGIIITFILGGIIHVLLYNVPFAYCITQLFYGAFLAIWAGTIYIRIIDEKIRNRIIVIAVLQIIYFILQTGRYSFFIRSEIVLRYFWYAFYIPMIFIIVVLYDISLYFYQKDDYKPRLINRTPLILGLILSLLFMTNDLHHLAFTPVNGVLNGDIHGYGIVEFIYIFYICIVLIAAIIKMMRKLSSLGKSVYLFAPTIVLFIGLIAVFLCGYTDVFKINNIRIWNTSELYAYTIMAFIETCILIDVIASNTSYKDLIGAIPFPMQIFENGIVEPVAEASQAKPEKIYRYNKMNIDGGKIVWANDITNLEELNNKLEEISNSLKSRNEYLETKNSMKSEQIEVEERNRLYDEIAKIVSPQLELINSLIDKADNTIAIAKISVLNAYIKRRSNLELLKQVNSCTYSSELLFSINESMEYLKLCGVDCGALVPDSYTYTVDEIIKLYEFFEKVVEKTLGELTAIALFISNDEEQITMNINLQAEGVENFSERFQENGGEEGYVTTNKDGDELIVAYRLAREVTKK